MSEDDPGSGRGGGRGRRLPLPGPVRRERFSEFVEHSVGAVALVCALFALLGYMYFEGTADPQSEMRHYPVAVVNLDEETSVNTPAGPQRVAVGEQIVGGLADNNDWSRLDLRIVSPEEAERGLRDGVFYGVVTIPESLSRDVAALSEGASTGGDAPPAATVTVATSPRASVTSVPVMQRLGQSLQASFDSRMGPQVADRATRLADARRQPPPPAAALTALAHPVHVVYDTWNPLPQGISNSTLPMFYAIVVVLAGFTGGMIIHNLMDARLGFMPLEVGPLSVAVSVTEHGRLVVLARKWMVTLVTAPLVSAIYLLVCRLVGIGGFSYWNAFWFSCLGIAAVGVCAHSIIAAVGSIGLLVNLVVFVVLGLPTSGGATPSEMLPPLFRALGEVEPMHQAYAGLRAIMFFDSSGAAGLTQACWVLVGWGLLGLVAGAVIAESYDRLGMRRQLLEDRVRAGDMRSIAREAVGSTRQR